MRTLLNNGWDQLARQQAAKHFKLEWTKREERHPLNFDIREGKAHAERVLGSGGLSQTAMVHPGSVSEISVRANEDLS